LNLERFINTLMTSKPKLLSEYILIPREPTDTEETKVVPADQKPKQPLKLVIPMAVSKMKLPQVTTWLNITISNTSAAATAQAPVIGVLPGSAAEFASYAALYSEYKCTRGQALYYLTASDAANVNSIDCIMTYEPVRNTALASAVAGLSASQFKLVTAENSGTDVGPRPRTQTGFWKFDFVVPNGPTKSVSEGTDLATGEWSDVADTANFSGYVKAYIQAASAGTTSLIGYLRMQVTFRCRQ
jgi:hypothetical protein